MEPSIDLVVVNWKTYGLIQDFLDSWEQYKPTTPSQVFLVDNDHDSTRWQRLKIPEGVRTLACNFNKGYAGGCNAGAKRGTGKYIALLNSDTRFINDTCVDTLVQFLEDNPDVANVGPFQSSSEGKITHGGVLGSPTKPYQRGWAEQDTGQYRDIVEAVTVIGSAFFTRRDVWNEMQECPIYKKQFPHATGAFPPFPHFFEETLYAYHCAGHGYKNYYNGEAEMIHEWHKSSAVGAQNDSFNIGQAQFRTFCDNHDIPHD